MFNDGTAMINEFSFSSDAQGLGLDITPPEPEVGLVSGLGLDLLVGPGLGLTSGPGLGLAQGQGLDLRSGQPLGSRPQTANGIGGRKSLMLVPSEMLTHKATTLVQALVMKNEIPVPSSSSR